MSVPFLTGLNSVDGDKRGTLGADTRGKPLIQSVDGLEELKGGKRTR